MTTREASAIGLLGVLTLVPLAPARPDAVGGLRAEDLVVPNDDGGWCWFQDERALVVGDRLVLGSVAAGPSSPTRCS